MISLSSSPSSHSLAALIVLVTQLALGASALNLQGEFNGDGNYVWYDIRSTVTLKCTADEPIANKINWYRNDTLLKEVGELKERYTISVSSDKKESRVVIVKAHNNDAGDYSCRYKDQRVDFELAGNVFVKVPSNTAIVEGETLRLHCTAVGTKIWIHWTLADNSTIDLDGEHDDDRISVKDEGDNKNAILVIENISKDFRGSYMCEGRHLNDISDRTVSSTSYIRVKDKLAALWPFIGICSEVFLLCLIIFISEKRRNKPTEDDESDTEQSDHRYDNKNMRYRK